MIVPTMYYDTPTRVFEEAGVSIAIWANHLLRASIAAMQQAARRIHAARSIEPLESEIVPVEEVFRLQDAGELEKAEKRYLPERRVFGLKRDGLEGLRVRGFAFGRGRGGERQERQGGDTHVHDHLRG